MDTVISAAIDGLHLVLAWMNILYPIVGAPYLCFTQALGVHLPMGRLWPG